MHARAYVLFVWEFRNDDITMISKENVSADRRFLYRRDHLDSISEFNDADQLFID